MKESDELERRRRWRGADRRRGERRQLERREGSDADRLRAQFRRASDRRVDAHFPEPEPIGGIYHPAIHRTALFGALVGLVALGMAGYAYATGGLVIADLGPLAASGPAVATLLAAGVGAAVGALTGALIGLYRWLPRRRIRPAGARRPRRSPPDHYP